MSDLLMVYLRGAVFQFKHLQVLRALAYCALDEKDRLDRHTRELRRCNQAFARIYREVRRRKVGGDPFPHAVPY